MESDLEFWGQRVIEHALFCELLLTDPTLRAEALRHRAALEAAYLAKDQDKTLAALDPFMEYKKRALAAQKNGTWIGWAFPSLIQHMIEEEAFFRRSLAGPPLSPIEVLRFWLHERRTETEASAKLLDPTAKKAETLFAQTAARYAQLEAATNGNAAATIAIPTANVAAEQNDVLRRSSPQSPLSVIAPILNKHVLREGERCVETMQVLAALGFPNANPNPNPFAR